MMKLVRSERLTSDNELDEVSEVDYDEVGKVREADK